MHDDGYMVASCIMAKSPNRHSARLGVDLPTGGMVKPQNVPAGGTSLMHKDRTIGSVGSLGKPYAQS